MDLPNKTAFVKKAMRIKTAVLAVVLLCFTIFPLFASSGSDFDTQFDKCFRAFLQPNQSDAVTAQNIQAIYTLTEEYQHSDPFLYAQSNGLLYFSTLQKIKNECESFLCGKASLQDAKSKLPLLIFEYYQETTKSYRYTWFLVLEILVIIIAISAFLAIFTVLFLRKKRTSLISETLLKAQEQERARFSYELHDSVVQDIKAEQLFVQMLASCVTKNQKSEELLYKIDLLEKKILSNLRNIIKNLSLPQFEKIPLENLITEYCAETAFINDIECPVYIASAVLLEKLSPDKKLHVFRIIQESISNAIKHGGATEIGVLIREDFEQRTLLIFVTDDGVGFDTTQTFSQNHFGLRAMKSRASFIKAKLTIESEKGDGTMVKLVLQG